jgi:bacterial leucyl aminopeptidase
MLIKKSSFILLPLLLLFTTATGSPGEERWITIGRETLETTFKQIGMAHIEFERIVGDVALLKINEESLPKLSHMMHEQFDRCAGYFRHESLEDALESLNSDEMVKAATSLEFADYSISAQNLVRPMIKKVEASRIQMVIEDLVSFKNRYYKSEHGLQAANWLAQEWRTIGKDREEISVELFEHARSPQPSVIMTIKGKSDDLIIVGGHLDSIAGWWSRARAKAPGADDNASGIATMSEVIRVLTETDFAPEKTIKFIAYAAEEVGLIGSQDIANHYAEASEHILGVLQLDMTNYNGSELDIVMMSDYTNAAQNEFLGGLIDTYLDGVTWGYDKCGYACSDHSSWTKVGFPASFPFESMKKDMNGAIHSAKDTLEASGGNANHAAKFAQLALAFIVELDR